MPDRKVVNKKPRYSVSRKSKMGTAADVPKGISIDRWDTEKWGLTGAPNMQKVFDTPKQLEAAFEQYVQWTKDHPLTTEQKSYGKGNKLTHRTTEILGRPLSISGFLSFCGRGRRFWDKFKQDNTDTYSDIIDCIEETCRAEKFNGAAVGKYNANLISRDLALADNMNVVDGRKQTSDLFPDDDEFNDKPNKKK